MLIPATVLADNKETVILADKLKDIGFRYANLAGISICLMIWLSRKGSTAIIDTANEEVQGDSESVHRGSYYRR